MFCTHCGSEVADHAVVCLGCGGAVQRQAAPAADAGVPAAIASTMPKSRVAYILLGLFLGGLGVHNFYAGYVGRGVAQLLISLCLGWLLVPLLAVYVWIIIEICTVDRDVAGTPFN